MKFKKFVVLSDSTFFKKKFVDVRASIDLNKLNSCSERMSTNLFLEYTKLKDENEAML